MMPRAEQFTPQEYKFVCYVVTRKSEQFWDDWHLVISNFTFDKNYNNIYSINHFD